MSLSAAGLQLQADAFIRLLADSAVAPNNVIFQQLLSASVAGPYKENTNKTYSNPGTTVIAAVKVRPQGPELKVSDLAMWRIGENTNVDAIFFVSQLENEARSLNLGVDAVNFRILWSSSIYTVLLCEPRSHVNGVPCYYHIKTVRSV